MDAVDKAQKAGGDLRHVSQHDLIPLELAAGTIFRRVYSERTQFHGPARLTAQLDGLAYAIAELVPIYGCEQNGVAVRLLSKDELKGALFEGGAKTITYVDGRPAIDGLAMNARHIEPMIAALLDSSSSPERG
jgi:hypothetical protein